MASPSCADDSLKLVGFNPDNFINTLVTIEKKIKCEPHRFSHNGSRCTDRRYLPPQAETLPAQLHRPARWKPEGKHFSTVVSQSLGRHAAATPMTCQWPRGRGNRRLAGWGCWVFSSRRLLACRTAAPCGCPMEGQPSPQQISPRWTHPSSGCHSKSTAK